MDHPLPWLRYLDADDVDDATIEFDGLKVRNAEMETLGKVEGFIVDSATAQPYYVVVDSGGWFKSKHYLMPIGQARIDDDNDALVVNLSKERINRFPGFDKGKFEKMTESELAQFNNETCVAVSTTAVNYPTTERFTEQWSRPQYATPSWWSRTMATADPAGGSAFSSGAEYPPSKVAPAAARGEFATEHNREQVRAKANDDRDRDAPRPNEDSPFFDGRAQPGDVIGLDTGGETTHVGDTAEDENKRRRVAEEAGRKERQ
jgi:hypothetical protein